MVTNIGFTCEIWRWKRYGIIGFTQDDISHGIPKALSDGESGNWNVRMGESNQWARDIINKFEMTRISVATLRVQIHTSNGGTTVLRPKKSIRDILIALVKEINCGNQFVQS